MIRALLCLLGFALLSIAHAAWETLTHAEMEK